MRGVGQTGWVFKVNGDLAAGRRDEARLKDGDTVLWYWAQFGIAGGPKTLVLSRVGKTNCYRVRAQDDNGTLTAAVGAVLHVGERTVKTQGATQSALAASVRIAACSCAPRSQAPCARTPSREPSRSRPRRCRPCGLQRRGEREGDALDHPRPRRSRARRKAGARAG